MSAAPEPPDQSGKPDEGGTRAGTEGMSVPRGKSFFPGGAEPSYYCPQPKPAQPLRDAREIDLIARVCGCMWYVPGLCVREHCPCNEHHQNRSRSVAAAPDNAEDRLRAVAHRLRLRVQLGGLSDTEAEAEIHAALEAVVRETVEAAVLAGFPASIQQPLLRAGILRYWGLKE